MPDQKSLIVRIRRGDEWYLGPDKKGRPTFGAVKKEDARVCLSRASAEALASGKKFEGAVVDVEEV